MPSGLYIMNASLLFYLYTYELQHREEFEIEKQNLNIDIPSSLSTFNLSLSKLQDQISKLWLEHGTYIIW